MKTDKPVKSREDRNVVSASVVIALILVMFFPMPAIVPDILMAVNLFLVLAVFLAVIFTGWQRRTKGHEEKPISDTTAIFPLFPAIFLLCSIFGLTVYVVFARLILTKGTGAGNKTILFFSGLVNTGETAGIITGFISIIAVCAAVTFITKKGVTRVTELAVRFLLDVMPETITAMEHAYIYGKISEEAFIRSGV